MLEGLADERIGCVEGGRSLPRDKDVVAGKDPAGFGQRRLAPAVAFEARGERIVRDVALLVHDRHERLFPKTFRPFDVFEDLGCAKLTALRDGKDPRLRRRLGGRAARADGEIDSRGGPLLPDHEPALAEVAVYEVAQLEALVGFGPFEEQVFEPGPRASLAHLEPPRLEEVGGLCKGESKPASGQRRAVAPLRVQR